MTTERAKTSLYFGRVVIGGGRSNLESYFVQKETTTVVALFSNDTTLPRNSDKNAMLATPSCSQIAPLVQMNSPGATQRNEAMCPPPHTWFMGVEVPLLTVVRYTKRNS